MNDRGLAKVIRTIVYLVILGVFLWRVGPGILHSLCAGPIPVPIC